jgi:hypothetical protein
MKSKMNKALLLVLVFGMVFAGPAYAADDSPESRMRAFGEVVRVDLTASTFTLSAAHGREYVFVVDRETQFRSPNGSVGELADLEVGMRALVIAVEDDELIARVVAAANLDDLPERVRAMGEIVAIELVERSFVLQKRDGERLTFKVDENTQFRSRDGSIQSLEDLEVGMLSLVIGVKQGDGVLIAKTVAAGYREDLPPNLRTFKGEISNVVPGQGTFTLTTSDGSSVTFQTSDRTRFRSRDSSIADIHDLKKGMVAFVAAQEGEDGGWLALLVAAGDPQDHPGDPKIDVRRMGKISSLGERSFTIQTRNGDAFTFSVDGSTKFRSRDGSVDSFDDLQIGMIAIVGAKELGNGQLKAVWVGVGQPKAEAPADQTRPSSDRGLPAGELPSP